MYTLKIEQDQDPENPREMFDNLGKMVCFHKRYTLGDKHDYETGEYDGWKDFEKQLIKEHKPPVILPLYLYDHSGITMSTRPFSCKWDSGQVGFIFATKEAVLKEFGEITEDVIDKVREALVAEVDTYDKYITGDVWGYVIEKDGETVEDSCWNYYGREEAEQEGQEVLAHLEKSMVLNENS